MAVGARVTCAKCKPCNASNPVCWWHLLWKRSWGLFYLSIYFSICIQTHLTILHRYVVFMPTNTYSVLEGVYEWFCYVTGQKVHQSSKKWLFERWIFIEWKTYFCIYGVCFLCWHRRTPTEWMRCWNRSLSEGRWGWGLTVAVYSGLGVSR